MTSTYRDFKINLTAHPVKKDLVLDTDEDAIKREIKNILLVAPGELPYDKLEFGVGLKQYLFENISPIYEQIIADDIERAIKNYSKRAVFISADVNVNTDQNGYDATITFRPINSSEKIELKVILDRVR